MSVRDHRIDNNSRALVDEFSTRRPSKPHAAW